MVRVSSDLRWADSHVHLFSIEEGADVALERARSAGIDLFVCVGTDLATSQACVEIGSAHPDVTATVGLHPHDATNLPHELEQLDALSRLPEVVGIGEAGFDLFYEHSSHAEQEKAFRWQIALAKELDKSLVIHSRDAWADTFRVLESEGVPKKTIFHCFTGGPPEAEKALALGCYLSFSGIITFKNADDLRAAAAITPLNRALVETDAPYLAPVPHRGKPNEPLFVSYVGEALAAIMGKEVSEVAAATRATTQRLLGN